MNRVKTGISCAVIVIALLAAGGCGSSDSSSSKVTTTTTKTKTSGSTANKATAQVENSPAGCVPTVSVSIKAMTARTASPISATAGAVITFSWDDGSSHQIAITKSGAATPLLPSPSQT